MRCHGSKVEGMTLSGLKKWDKQTERKLVFCFSKIIICEAYVMKCRVSCTLYHRLKSGCVCVCVCVCAWVCAWACKTGLNFIALVPFLNIRVSLLFLLNSMTLPKPKHHCSKVCDWYRLFLTSWKTNVWKQKCGFRKIQYYKKSGTIGLLHWLYKMKDCSCYISSIRNMLIPFKEMFWF